MTPDFFQAVYPVFPFTYGINALRETIGGFYGLQWLGEVGMLLLYFLAFFVIGFLLRPYLTNVNRMFGKQIAASDILNGEEAKLPARRYRMDQLFRVLADREEYRSQLAESAKRFMGLYPALKARRFLLWFGGARHRHPTSLPLGLRESDYAYVLAYLVGGHHHLPCCD